MLNRIAELDPQLHAFALVTPDLALKQASEADKRLGRGEGGPLTGVPLALKVRNESCFASSFSVFFLTIL
jgi:aspartyl-tRNA(Asn)/glutamyl-tRNA(Gln) amidotransferase subunit A